MKIAIITDTHFGGRRGSKVFHEFFQKFYEDIFFPTLKERGIEYCIHMGDAFDNRKNIDFWSLNWAKENVYDKFKNLGVKVWQLVGNHDVYYKNTNQINSIDALLCSYDNVIPISEPGEYDINGFKAFMLPWICDDNYQQTQSAIKKTKSKIAFGHLELQGFELYPGCVQQRGIDKGIIKKFDLVFSGHYHTRSNDGQVYYLGNPYEMYWNDCGDKRGFNIFDTEDRTMEFIENPYSMFKKIYYEDTPEATFKSHLYKDKIVKLFVRSKKSQLNYDKFLSKLLKVGVNDLKIIENTEVNDREVDLDDEKVEDTLTLLNKYIEDSDFELKKDRVKELLKEVYLEACEAE
jgi:DNA repair exonuclease SbcCD nuclease subunit